MIIADLAMPSQMTGHVARLWQAKGVGALTLKNSEPEDATFVHRDEHGWTLALKI